MMKNSLALLTTFIIVFLTAAGCGGGGARATAQPTTPPAPNTVTIKDVEKDPEAFRDRRVRIQGYGVIVATLPLCQGYVGKDRRYRFMDAAGDLMVAEVAASWPSEARLHDPDHLRTFEGYIRVFSGEIGCPGATKVETFPYFEVTGVR